ncbi:MAG TPA: IreB family regulatory phosphoprotein [Bacillota bacterium]|nr:IreB family regulatory phosphoprotein [Bacillota bacterium]
MSFTDKKNLPVDDKTMIFSLRGERDREIGQILQTVYDALKEKGYKKPIDQIAGYILSEDPTYITNHNNARVLIRRIDRDELLRVLLQNYLTL